jgi:hypothetical protein
MPATDWEDLDAFFDPSDFGTPATLVVAGKTVTTSGMFDDPTITAEMSRRGQMDRSPEFDVVFLRFYCPLAKVAGVVKNTAITIEDTIYNITRVEPDGTGMVSLYLEHKRIVEPLSGMDY